VLFKLLKDLVIGTVPQDSAARKRPKNAFVVKKADT